MTARRSILFVCTGNVFRSLAAEECLKRYLSDNKISGWDVASAGTIAAPQSIDPKTLTTLATFGIDASKHKRQRVTRELLDQYDVVVAMAEDHVEFMRLQFDYQYALLFNELALGEPTSIPDVEDVVDDYATNRDAVETYIEQVVQNINNRIPALFKNAQERFFLFEDFVSGVTTHRNGYPFIILYETQHSVAFMSIDIPPHEDGHVLVIPKQRYPNLADIPQAVLQDLLHTIKKVGEAIAIDHGGYNLLLNNGIDAGQYIIHAHFHIIPRKRGDGIVVEEWKRPTINQNYFIEINEKLKQQIKNLPASISRSTKHT